MAEDPNLFPNPCAPDPLARPLVIVGIGDYPRLLHYYLREDDPRQVVAFSVDRDFLPTGDGGTVVPSFDGLPLVPFDMLPAMFPPSQYDVLLGMGYSRMNENRKRKFFECKEMGYRIASYFHSSCSIHTDDIGEGNIMLERCLVYPFSKIGDGNLMFDTVNISHDSVVGSFNFFAGGTDLCGFCEIGDNCFFGKGSVLDEHFKAADYTLVGAGAYARGETAPYDVIVPQRSVRLVGRRSTDFR